MTVKVREWEPQTAPVAEIEAALRTLNDVLDVDLPDDPRWRMDSFREYLSVTLPSERRISWLAERDDAPEDHPLGHASLLVTGDVGVFDMTVRPDVRRNGVGVALLAEAARRASAEGVEALGVEVPGDTSAVGFYETHGFSLAVRERRHVLDLSDVDWLRLGEMAGGVARGYRIEYHPGGPPAEMFDAYAACKASLRGGTTSTDLELRPSSYDSSRLRASIATLNARGLKPYIVLAVHERTDEVVGLTEVVVPAQRPSRADQYDTVVLREHRGYGISRAIKARMLFELRAAEPLLRDVQTWNAASNAGINRINAELGFVADREWREYEADVADLLRRL
jgi:GNAT superfamily N-acetyltransferase